MGLRDRLLLSGLTRGYAATLRPAWERFDAAAKDPHPHQARGLVQFLEQHQHTLRGQRCGYGRLDGIRAFQDQVPVGDYEAYREDIDRIARGEPGVLTTEPVRVLERSSGTTGGAKLIPYGAGLLRDFQAATGPWLWSLFQHRPQLHGTRSYWSVSPVARTEERSSGGLRIGFEDDTEYFDPLSRFALSRLLSVPSEVRNLPMEEWRDATLRHLLADEELGFISVWSPTFLTELMSSLARRLDHLLLELPPRRAADILRGLDRYGAITGPALWPRLSIISCWADGPAAAFLPTLKRWFPGVELQPKGLLSTEGVISFPLTVEGQPLPGAVAAVTSHFLEFVDLDHPTERPRLVGELVVGGRYTPLLTTSGGLARYALRDEVECVGRYRSLPLLRFVAKLDRVSDLVGEKMTAADVDRALVTIRQREPLEFALLVPELSPHPRYRLLLEGPIDDQTVARIGGELDRLLTANPQYRYARELGQLGEVVAQRVKQGWTIYQAERIRRGQKAGDLKPTQLDPELGWAEVYGQPAALTGSR
jgi:hypothetical protein